MVGRESVCEGEIQREEGRGRVSEGVRERERERASEREIGRAMSIRMVNQGGRLLCGGRCRGRMSVRTCSLSRT